jgi:hypothetical protein
MTVKLLELLTSALLGGFIWRLWYSRPMLSRELIGDSLGGEAPLCLAKADLNFLPGEQYISLQDAFKAPLVSTEDQTRLRSLGEIHISMCDRISLGDLLKEPLIKSHIGRCGKNGLWARRLRGRIPAVGCTLQENTAPGLLSPNPGGLKRYVDFCINVSRRPRPLDCFAGYNSRPATRLYGVALSGETGAGIDSLAPARFALTGLPAANLPKPLPQLCVAQHSRLNKSNNCLQRPSWYLITGSLMKLDFAI